MRVIKFRAWNNENYGHTNNPRGMYVGFSFKNIYSGRDEANTTCEDGKILSEPDWEKLILMQFTGLKDKNGKEIYSGDFIKVSEATYKMFREVGWKKRKEKPVYLVDYYDDLYGFGKKDINQIKGVARDFKMDIQAAIKFVHHTYLWLIKDDKELEVIGNIYSNPELLKDEND